jgi:hypothetical protein
MTTSSGKTARQGVGTAPSKHAVVMVSLVLALGAAFGGGVSVGRASGPSADRVHSRVDAIDVTEFNLRGPAAALHRRIYRHFPNVAQPARS